MSDAEQGNDPDTTRPLLVVPDANVLIHGKALVDLPWAELDRPYIEVVFVPPTIRELDKLKTQTGRPNKIARQLSSDIRALIAALGRQAEVRKAGPWVVKRIELQSVSEAVHPALRLDHADQALINYALRLAQEGADVLLLTDDTICGTTAQEVGLAVHFLPESWLRPAETDESAKENAKLKAEIQRLSAAEPQLELGFRADGGVALTELRASLLRWPALSPEEVDTLMASVERVCPPATSFERPTPRASYDLVGGLARFERISQLGAFASRSVYEPATEEEIERYKDVDYPKWQSSVRQALERLHEQLDGRTTWPSVVALAANVGTRPAAQTLLTIQARGAFLLSNNEEVDGDRDEEGEENGASSAFPELPLPPTPPRGRTKTIDLLGLHGRGVLGDATGVAQHLPFIAPHLLPPKPRDSDAFYWRAGRRDWTSEMELECASWRHRQEQLKFPLKLRPIEQKETAGAIELSIHAHNISGPQQARLPVRVSFEDGKTYEEAKALVELLGRHARSSGRL